MNKFISGIACGAAGAFILTAMTAYFVITSGILPARQDEPSSNFEKWAAHQSLKATIKSQIVGLKNPLPTDEKNLAAGAKIYEGNCSGCHGAPLSPSPSFASAYSPPAPIFSEPDNDVDHMDEAKIYWMVDHGIKFTGMPSFNRILNEEELWQVSMFLKNIKKLPAPVDKTWKLMH